MKTILRSTKFVTDNSNDVRIDERSALNFGKNISEKDFKSLEIFENTYLDNASEEEQIGLKVVFNTINFCYWGEPKWTVEINGKKYDGSHGLILVIIEAHKKGHKLLDPAYLESIAEKDLKKLLTGNVEIPLLKERLKLLKIMSHNILKKFKGSYKEIVSRANYDCENLVNILVDEIPEVFNDTAIYCGKEIKFYKRAQLLADNIYSLSECGLISSKLKGEEKLTSFADYKLPQLLRKFGVLKYSDGLAEKVDNMIKIPHGSKEEIEIRANNVQAVEIINKEVQKRFPESNPAKIDKILWLRGQKKSTDDKPYHRTRTIWY